MFFGVFVMNKKRGNVDVLKGFKILMLRTFVRIFWIFDIVKNFWVGVTVPYDYVF